MSTRNRMIFTQKLRIVIILSFAFFVTVNVVGKNIEEISPIKIELPINFLSEMKVGTHRVLEVLYYSGNDDRNSDCFKNVTKRDISWRTWPKGIVSVDPYGRVTALKSGFATITVQSLSNPSVYDTKFILVDNNPIVLNTPKVRVVSYLGKPAKEVNNLQKIVSRFSVNDVSGSLDIPENIKKIFANPSLQVNNEVSEGSAVWTIVNFADGSCSKYIKRVDNSLSDSNRDKVQYFMGNRYLPGDGKSPTDIEDDGNNGLWVIAPSGVNHIAMISMSYMQKAEEMEANTIKYISRMGLVSNSSWDGQKWVPQISDNDGLWSSMYGVGELMRYAVLKREGAPASEVKVARESALKTLKAVLLLSNISGREGEVNAKIRYLTNTRLGDGNILSNEYLKYGKTFAIDNFVGSPVDDGINFYGVDAGSPTESGVFRYSLEGINSNDWTTIDDPAYSKRTLKGFIARSFCIPAIEDVPYGDGLFIKRNANGTQTVLSGANKLYDFISTDHPVLSIGNDPIPDVLKDVINVNGKQYNVSDMCYKGDTSTDEIIGHLFIYKTAFDILNSNDPEEEALKELVVNTVENYAQHILDNGYQLVDATGQGTTWGKTSRDYFNSDFTIDDASLNSLVQLMALKLAYYMTGEYRWQDEYLLLATGSPFRYLDLDSQYWNRLLWLTEHEDADTSKNMYRLNIEEDPSYPEMKRHAMYCLNYSDEEMAMLAYYLVFQMETDPILINEYRVGLDGWWAAISYSENPLWYYIYQLAHPNKKMKDAFDNNLLETAAWQLSRHPIDTRTYQAFIYGARNDVLIDNLISIDPNVIIGKRTSTTDAANANSSIDTTIDPKYDPNNIYQIKVLPQDERSLHKFNGTNFRDIDSYNINNMEGGTTYTLPFWFGLYHHMLKGG